MDNGPVPGNTGGGDFVIVPTSLMSSDCPAV